MSEPARCRAAFRPAGRQPQLIAAAMPYTSNKRVRLEINPDYSRVKHGIMKKK